MDCIACGYSLEGLPERGVCPECGIPIARSRDVGPPLRPALCDGAVGRVYLAVFVAAIIELLCGAAIPWPPMWSGKFPEVCLLATAYAMGLVSLCGWTWSCCTRWEDVPVGVPSIALLASLLFFFLLL